jgi:diguanylate cyclase (GGDEF)-like protein
MNGKSLLLAAAGAAAAATFGVPALRAAYAAGRASTLPALATARRAATVDSLTGAANRVGLYAELDRRARGRDSYAVLLLDLDGFKQVNDRFGHAAGDAVLVAVAGRLSALVAGAGLVARLGGDEFVLVASSPMSVVSTLLGHDVARAVAHPVDVDGALVAVRASVGVVQALPGDPARAVLRSADVAMYRAKAAGAGVVTHEALDLVDVVDDRPAARLRELTATGRQLRAEGVPA